LEAQNGESLGGFIMKEPKLSNLVIDEKGTREMRERFKKTKKIKITINIDADSLEHLREISDDTGVPYQKLLNRMLKDSLKLKGAKSSKTEDRVLRLEKEVEKLKEKLAA